MPDDKKHGASQAYDAQLRRIGERLALLDEAAARELLEEIEDHTEALISERESIGKPLVSLADMRRSLGLDG